jgi:hypothetical protein
MPGFDRTGPQGQGPMTGGGFGYCGAGRRRGDLSALGGRDRRPGGGRGFGPGRGRGMARGRGIGRGYGRPWELSGAPLGANAETALSELQRQAEDLKAHLKDLEARIAEAQGASY